MHADWENCPDDPQQEQENIRRFRDAYDDPPNPYELLNRERKAQGIATAFMMGYKLLHWSERLDESASERARNRTQEQRDEIARVAGYRHSPSERTWARVVEILEARETAGPSLPSDPFEGIAR